LVDFLVKMKIIVKNLKGNQFEIEIEPSNTVQQVKEKIQEEQKIDAATQKLVAVGKVMADDKTVEEYKLKDGDFIVVMISKPKPVKKKEPEPTAAPTPAPTGGSSMPTPPVSAPSMPSPAPTPSAQPSPANPPAPVPQPAPGAEGNAEGGAGIMRGEELEKTLEELQNMGFPRDECMRALRAAYYNPDRAVEYLLSGIPEEPEVPQPGAGAGASAGAAGAATGAEGGEGGANPLAFLANNPMFTQLRQRIVQDPSFFQTFMNQLAQTQPQLHQAISQNPQAFLALLLGGAGGAGGDMGPENDPPGTIRVTQEEKDAIERLTALGFPKHRAIEAYFACDKNEEWAANYLFENGANDDQYDEQVVQEESAAEAQAQNPGGDAPMQQEGQNQAEGDNMNVDQPANNEGGNDAPANNEGGNNEGGNNDEDESCL
jgi:UV excision repair protein RAD23